MKNVSDRMNNSNNRKAVLVGIAGASGSGKTMVANSIVSNFGVDNIVFLQSDSYYIDLSHLPLSKRTQINFDHPDSFDYELLVKHLKQLLNGKKIEHSVYDFTTHTRKKEKKTLYSKKIIILEGILIFAIPEIRNLIDIKILIDAPLDICFIRRLKRDMEERGRSMDAVIEQYMKTVRPMYFQFIEPSKHYADIVIPHGGMNKTAIDIIQSKIENLLKH